MQGDLLDYHHQISWSAGDDQIQILTYGIGMRKMVRSAMVLLL
jgi:hypothetical protein